MSRTYDSSGVGVGGGGQGRTTGPRPRRAALPALQGGWRPPYRAAGAESHGAPPARPVGPAHQARPATRNPERRGPANGLNQARAPWPDSPARHVSNL